MKLDASMETMPSTLDINVIQAADREQGELLTDAWAVPG
jgi:hypothetical protein